MHGETDDRTDPSVALAKAARALTAAPDDELAPFVSSWEDGELDAAFDALRAAGERWADTPTFWYLLVEAAQALDRPADGEAILDAHGV